MQNIKEEEYKRRVNDFLEAHKDEYTTREYNYIKKNAAWGLQAKNGFHITDILRQVYAEVGLLPEEQDMYNGFIKLIQDNFDMDRNIVEVAGGIVPSLAKKIALKQNGGTITVYDKRVITPDESPENLVVKRQMFSKDTQIPSAEMIIGFMPCDATIDIIEAACKNNIDFMVALCEGGSQDKYGYLESDEEWIENVEYVATRSMRQGNMGKLAKTYLKEYGNPYPVIYNVREKS